MRRNEKYSYQLLPNSTNFDAIEDENERMTENLEDKISTLKSLSIDMGTEVNYQNRMILGMDDDFERTSGSLSSSIGRILRLSRGNHACFIVYLCVICLVVFFVLWIALKLRQ